MQNKISPASFLWMRLMLLEEEDLVREALQIGKFKEP